MSRGSTGCPKRHCQAFDQRRGVVALLLLLSLVVVLGVASLAINQSWMTSHRMELKEAATAAALAGAAQLFNPAPSTVADSAAAARLAKATDQASVFFAANSVAVLNTAGANTDVLGGWCEDPTVPGAKPTVWTGTGALNALTVRGVRRRTNGQAVVLWFGNLFGMSNAEPAAAATATMDQRVYGFRPLEMLTLPMMPLAVPATIVWPSAAPGSSAGTSDLYTVDPRTGAVTAGADGIAEITLMIPVADGEFPSGQTAATWLSLPTATTNNRWMAMQITDGLDATDLPELGGQFALGADGTLLVAAAASPTAGDADALVTAMLDIRGQKRIWPISAVNPNLTVSCQITGFAAGCIVDCSRDSNVLKIVVQACTIQTCTALLRVGTARNPWIGKLILNE